MDTSRLPPRKVCHIGPYGAHTYNYERTECIWCGPNSLAYRTDGTWIPLSDGGAAWSVPVVEELFA